MSRNDTQKVILITGASSGFGLLTAARLAAQGHFVYATMRDLKKQQPLLDEVAKRGGQVLVRELDVTKTATIVKVIEEIKERNGHIDVIVNNAGFGLGGFFEDLSEEEIRWQMEVNFFGVQNVCRQILPLMRERGQGHIINISSIAGLTAAPALGAYNASKWALEGFSQSLSYELSLFGIKVVLVEPGSYPTKIFGENACYAQRSADPQSPYYALSVALRDFVEKFIRSSKKDPEAVAALIERIINTPKPKLRYFSDLDAAFQVFMRKRLPDNFYPMLFRRMLNENSKHTV